MRLFTSPTTKLFLVLLSFAVILFSCVRHQRDSSISSHSSSASGSKSQAPGTVVAPLININTASAQELERLPTIGKGLAARIVEHREKNGPFRRPEHLIMVRGISDKRFRALRELITVE